MADRSALLRSLLPAIIVFAIDRSHKYYQIEMSGWRGGEYQTVTGFFDYVLVWNPGISYGLFDALPPWVLLIIMSLAMALLAIWWWRAETVLVRYGLALALGGASSHIVDRLIYGAVPDFFHLHWGEVSFYVFNVSDMAITFGVGLLLLDMVWSRPADIGKSQ